MRSCRWSGTWSAGTRKGPVGRNVGRLLARSQSPPRALCWGGNWRSRALTSLHTVYPATCSIARSRGTLYAREPMTTANSASQSTCADSGGSTTSSSGPQIALGSVTKTNGLPLREVSSITSSACLRSSSSDRGSSGPAPDTMICATCER